MPASRSPLVAGFDIGGTHVRGVLLDRGGNLIATDRLPKAADPEALVEAVVELVERLADAAGDDVRAVGVGCAGTVDRRGVVRQSPNILYLVEYPLGAELGRRLKLPTIVDNDATTATWAEVTTGAARGLANVVFVALGTGIGAGIVLDGELRRGAQGFAGEAGHMIVDPDGPACPCGRNGCWEMYASGAALGRLARAAALEGRAPTVVEAAGGNPDDVRGEHLTPLIAGHDPVALDLLEELGWWVGLGLNNLVNVLDVSAAVIGGGLSETGAPLIDAITRGYARHQVDRAHRPPLNVVAALHGGRAGAIGAALLAGAELAS